MSIRPRESAASRGRGRPAGPRAARAGGGGRRARAERHAFVAYTPLYEYCTFGYRYMYCINQVSGLLL